MIIALKQSSDSVNIIHKCHSIKNYEILFYKLLQDYTDTHRVPLLNSMFSQDKLHTSYLLPDHPNML